MEQSREILDKYLKYVCCDSFGAIVPDDATQVILADWSEWQLHLIPAVSRPLSCCPLRAELCSPFDSVP